MKTNYLFRILELSSDKMQKLIFLFLIIVGLFIFVPDFFSQKDLSENQYPPDTLVPAGFTLVPIDLQNAEAISSIIEGFAIVDLYTGSSGKKRADLLGRNIKLIRAPLNPEKYAVLVPVENADIILGSPGPVYATLLNRNVSDDLKMNQKKRTQSKIQYHVGGPR
jgi:hypothetical protein